MGGGGSGAHGFEGDFFAGGEPAVEGAAAVEEGEDAWAGGGGEGGCGVDVSWCGSGRDVFGLKDRRAGVRSMLEREREMVW